MADEAVGVTLALVRRHPKRWLATAGATSFRPTPAGVVELLDAAGVHRKDAEERGPSGVRAPMTPDEARAFIGREQARWWTTFSANLASAERSPAWAARWLNDRALPAAWTADFSTRAVEEGYLSADRYAVQKLDAAARRGGDPLWVLKKKLAAEGAAAPAEALAAYDEAAALRALIERRYGSETDAKKLGNRLRLRGYAGPLVRRVLEERFGSGSAGDGFAGED